MSNLFDAVKVTALPSAWERAANSVYHLKFYCLLGYVCPSFPLMFGVVGWCEDAW